MPDTAVGHCSFNLRRCIRQTRRAEFSARAFGPLRAHGFAPRMHGLAVLFSAAVLRSISLGVSDARGTAATALPSPKFPCAPLFLASNTAKHRAAGRPAAARGQVA